MIQKDSIPKTVHYCWFGRSPMPKLAHKCLASWKKFCPGYEIREWNEDNFDVQCCDYVKEAYSAKKFAFVSDYARYAILHKYGGLYFDTDVELISPIDMIVARGAFMGCETDGCDISQQPHSPNAAGNIAVNPGLGIGSLPGHPFYRQILDFYSRQHFILQDGTYNTKTIVKYTTELLMQLGLKNVNELQCIDGIWIYPKEYFCPLNDSTGKMDKTANTVSIHWYSKSWIDKKDVLRSRITRPIHRIFGAKSLQWLKKLLSR